MSVSTVALGTIEFTPYWTGTGDVSGNFASSEAEANASGEQDYEYSYAYGSMDLITTEAGEFDYFYYIEANAWAHIFYEEELPALAWGDAEAKADLSEFTEPPIIDISAYAYISHYQCGDPPDLQYSYYYPDPKSTGWHNQFEEYEGIYGEHEVKAKAQIYEGSDNVTMGWADAGAFVDLDEREE